MARLAVAFTVIFFFFTVSHARTSLDSPETDVIDRDVSNTKPTLPLPRENPESDSLVTEFNSETADIKPLEVNPFESTENLPEYEIVTVDSLRNKHPSARYRIRLINRHFPPKQQRPPGVALPLHRRGARLMDRHFRIREVPYGNDMLMAGESGDSDRAMFRGGMRQNPPGLVRFHHHHDHDNWVSRFPYKHHMSGKEKFKRPFHREDEEEEREKGMERKEKKGAGGGFMKGIRKFLNHF